MKKFWLAMNAGAIDGLLITRAAGVEAVSVASSNDVGVDRFNEDQRLLRDKVTTCIVYTANGNPCSYTQDSPCKL